MLKLVKSKILENHCTGKKRFLAQPLIFKLTIFSAPGVILQLDFIQLLQNDFYIHYLHFMKQRLVKKELPKDSRKQDSFMLSLVCSNVDHTTD